MAMRVYVSGTKGKIEDISLEELSKFKEILSVKEVLNDKE